MKTPSRISRTLFTNCAVLLAALFASSSVWAAPPSAKGASGKAGAHPHQASLDPYPPPPPTEEEKRQQRYEAIEKAMDALYADKATASPITPEERARRVIAVVLNAYHVTVEQANTQAARDYARPQTPDNIFTLSDGGTAIGLLVPKAYEKHDSVLVRVMAEQGIKYDGSLVLVFLASLADKSDNERAHQIIDALADKPIPILDMQSLFELAQQLDMRLVSRLAAKRIKQGGRFGTEFGQDRLQTLASQGPQPTEATDPSLQAAAGKYDTKTSFYIPMRPDGVPSLTPGQRFFALCDANRELILKDAVTGAPVSRDRFALRELTLLAFDQTPAADPDLNLPNLTLRFRLPGYNNPVIFQGVGSLYDLPGLYPTVDDAALRNLRAQYEGHRVWGYGGIAVSAPLPPGVSSGYSPKNESSVVVRHIVRLRSGHIFSMNMGTSPGYSGEMELGGYATRDPLVVIIDPVPGGQMESHGFSYMNVGNPDPGMSTVQVEQAAEHGRHASEGPNSSGFYTICADRWDFERLFSPVSLAQASRAWPPKYRKAAANGTVVRGMTPEMVVWVAGWPCDYGTLADLKKRAVWEYGDLPGHPQEAHFVRGKYDHWYRYQMP